jgi:stalled ribosome alternative rescue factor ArfA
MSGSMDATCTAIEALLHGPLYRFANWPVGDVPKTGSLVYTVWDRAGAFVYVGMAGRGGTVSSKGKGPYGRLGSHASGRRSGDQFCVYVCDRFVLPRIHNRIPEIAAGKLHWMRSRVTTSVPNSASGSL